MELKIAAKQTHAYTVTTPVYEGPLNLLLQLIEHAELDITAVSLAQVTDQYLDYIHRIAVPPDEISAFLVLAAKLIQIKSEALLPRPPVRETGEDDPGEALARQLRIYKRFKELSAWLEEREARGLRTHLRIAPPPKLESRLDLTDISIVDLLEAAETIFALQHDKQALSTVIAPPKITIREKILLIANRLGKSESTRFTELIDEHSSRMDVVVTFLALLELVKRYRVSALQNSLFSDIEIVRGDGWDETDDIEIEYE
ncbi:MAG: segregation/condensation protein A [Chloroflexota bacterium]